VTFLDTLGSEEGHRFDTSHFPRVQQLHSIASLGVLLCLPIIPSRFTLRLARICDGVHAHGTMKLQIGKTARFQG